MVRILFIVASLAGLLKAQTGCVAAPQGLSAWFTFDEEIFRQPGEHRPQLVPGRVGHALRFNGKDHYFEVPVTTPGFDAGEDDFTIELWIRTADSGHTRNIVDKRDHRPLGYLIFLQGGGHAGFQVDNELIDGNIARSAYIADNRWHHVAGVVQRLPLAHLGIYVDGFKQPETSLRNASLANLDVATPVWLGRHHANKLIDRDNLYFEGEIDELSFYHRALTAAEILSIYRAGSHGKCRQGKSGR
jgi:concanavalin A-like lectin/glucanase superfamily protein